MAKKRHPGRPPKTDWTGCKVKGCTKITKGGAKGMCPTHYAAAHRGRIDMETGEELRPMKRVRSYGVGARCRVEGCGNRPKGNGLCHGHWQQKKDGKELKLLRPRKRGPFKKCVAPNCRKRVVGKGLCSGHAEQRRRGLIDDRGNKLRDRMKGGRPRKERHQRDGYVLIWAPEGHPSAQKNGLIYEHRLVMEQRLGRHLKEWEIIHHKDGNRSNNYIENLELMDGRARKSRGHPPAHEYDLRTAVAVVLQQELPTYLRRGLESYLRRL